MKYSVALLLLLLFYFCSISNVMSQSQYLPGWVILANGDTLSGMVKDRKQTFTGPEIYQQIRFKSHQKKRRKKYRPEELAGYQINEVAYESVWLRPASSGIHLLNPYYESVPNAGDCVFLRVVSKGKLSHYQWEWEDGSQVESMDLFRRSGEPIFIRATQGIFGLKRKQLTKFFTDCPALQEKLQKKELSYAWEVTNYYNEHCR